VTTALVLALFALVLLGGFATFLVLELYALSNKTDDFHTLSTYIKRARRRVGIWGGILLTTLIVSPASWLWGHLVMEWW
jgi:hypothetical protein